MNTSFDQRQQRFWADSTNLRRYDHPVVQMFAEQRVEYLARLFGAWSPTSALDVGCGDGVGMYYMRRITTRIQGCDRSATMLEANPAPPTSLKRCDAYQLPYEDGQFELVYCWELLHHVGRPELVVREMTRVASKAVLVCEPNCINPAMALFGLVKAEERGLFRFTPWYTKQLLVAAGLTAIRWSTGGCVAPNRMPEVIARPLAKLPYHIPVVGLSTIALGYKTSPEFPSRAIS